MKEIFDYINNNSFLTTIIGVIVGSAITSFTTVYISYKERKERKREVLNVERKRQFENKAELKIEKVLDKSDNIPHFEVFIAPFKIEYHDDMKDYDFIFPKEIKNKKLHKYKEFHIKNIGNADINQLDICATFKRNNFLIEYNRLNYLVDNNFVHYNYCYDRKILKNDEIIIRVYYLDGFQIFHPFSCTLSILFRDSFNNLYEQPFWYEKDNLYEPRLLDFKEYNEYVTSKSAYDEFDRPCGR